MGALAINVDGVAFFPVNLLRRDFALGRGLFVYGYFFLGFLVLTHFQTFGAHATLGAMSFGGPGVVVSVRIHEYLGGDCDESYHLR